MKELKLIIVLLLIAGIISFTLWWTLADRPDAIDQAEWKTEGNWTVVSNLTDLDITGDDLIYIAAIVDKKQFAVRCTNGETSVLYEPETDYRSNSFSVRHRLDGIEQDKADWLPANNLEIVSLWNDRAIEFMRNLHAADPGKLEMKFAWIVGANWDTFDMTGIRRHIEAVADTCGWNLH